MTREDLTTRLMDDFTIEFYNSRLSHLVDCRELVTDGEMEAAAFELLDELSHSVLETMEAVGVLKVKKEIHA